MKKVKITVDIDEEDYYKFSGSMQHGQIAQIIRKFIKAINAHYETPDGKQKVCSWAWGNKNLTIKQIK